MEKKRVLRVVPAEGKTNETLNADGFLRLHRDYFQLVYDDHSTSEPYLYEYVERKGVDCVAIAVYRFSDLGELQMGLINSVRTATQTRRNREPVYLREVVAGSLEEGETQYNIKKRIMAEVEEEAGIRIPCEWLIHVWPGGFFPSIGQSNEKVFLAAVNVTGLPISKPEGDGSVTESTLTRVEFFPVKEVLRMCKAGDICDGKTEVLAYRLRDAVREGDWR